MARKGRKRTRTTPKQRAAARRNLEKARRRRRIAKGVVVGAYVGANFAVAGARVHQGRKTRRKIAHKAAYDRHLYDVGYGVKRRKSTRGPSVPLHTPKAIAGRKISHY